LGGRGLKVRIIPLACEDASDQQTVGDKPEPAGGVPTDYLEFEYILFPGRDGTANITWNDKVVNSAWATCNNAYNVWVDHLGQEKQNRTRDVRCEFNC